MNWPPDRFNDNRWNQCLDALIAAWNRAGPDATLAALRDLELGAEDGKDAATEDGRDPTWDEAVADFEAAEPVTVIQPHAFAEATAAPLDICWCGKGSGHLIHKAAAGGDAA